MAAPTLPASLGHAGNPTTAPTITFGTTAAGDLLLVGFTNGGSDSDPTLSGTTITTGGLTWAKVTSVGGGVLTDMNGSVWWARATGNHTGQTVIAATTNSGAAVGARVAGALASGTPTEVIASVLNASGVNALVGAAPSVNETLLLLFLFTDDNIASDTVTATGTPASYAEQQDALSTGGVDTAAALYSGTGTTASTGTLSWNNARGAGIYQVAILVAVKPVPAAQSVSVVAVAETEAARTVTPVPGARSIAVGKPIETEVAQAVAVATGGPAQSTAVNSTAETEAAAVVAVIAQASVTVATTGETEQAQFVAVATTVAVTVDAVTELDQGRPVAAVASTVSGVAVAVETEAVEPVAATGLVIAAANPATETEAAGSIAADAVVVHQVAGGDETETAGAVAVVAVRTVVVSAAAEAEDAEPVEVAAVVAPAVGAVAEAEASQTVIGSQSGPQSGTVTAAIETETVHAIAGGEAVITVGAATETEMTYPVGIRLRVVTATELETISTAEALTSLSLLVGSTAENETASQLLGPVTLRRVRLHGREPAAVATSGREPADELSGTEPTPALSGREPGPLLSGKEAGA